MKEFKRYNNQFRKERAQLSEEDQQRAHFIQRWNWHVSSWGQNAVQVAVYSSSTALHWQKFRVSLRGLTTQEKLFLLNRRKQATNLLDDNEAMLEAVRIDNYIGALRRGGQLDEQYRIVR